MPTLRRWQQLLGVEGVAQAKSQDGTTIPASTSGNDKRRIQIETPDQRSGAETRLAAGKAFGSGVVRPVKGRLPDMAIHAGRFKAGSVQDGDDVAGSRALEVLVALHRSVVEKTVGRVGQKSLRLHFRIHRLGENFIEGQAEDERTQIIDVGDAAEIMSKRVFRVEPNFVSALVDRRTADAAIEDAEIIEIDVGFFARARAKFALRRPTAPGEVFGARSAGPCCD